MKSYSTHKVTISLDFDSLKDDLHSVIAEKLDEYYEDEVVDKLLESFEKNFGGHFVDAVFEVEINEEKSEIECVSLVGGQ